MKLKGFTLIELIVVMGILAILATIVIIAVNPARQFAASRNAKRANDVRALQQAINQHAADNNGQLAVSITTSPQVIGTSNLDLTSLLVPSYLSEIPRDPLNGTVADTKYTVFINSAGSVVVRAPNAELSAIINSEGNRNYALRLDGTNDIVLVPDSNSLDITTNFTLEGWVKLNLVSGGEAAIFGKYAGDGYLLDIVGGQIRMYTPGVGTGMTSGSTLAAGSWYHVAVTYDGTTMRIWVNGSQVGSQSTSGTVNVNTRNLGLGGYHNATMTINGWIDEFRISNTVRYTGTFTPQTRFTLDSNTLALWHFDEGAGTTTLDSSANNNTGTLTNGPVWDIGQ